MGFLMLLDPLLHKGGRMAYQEHVDEVVMEDQHPDGQTDSGEGPSGARGRTRTLSGSESIISRHPKAAKVLDKVTEQQTKWKRQVQEQRRNIYDAHTMLN